MSLIFSSFIRFNSNVAAGATVHFLRSLLDINAGANTVSAAAAPGTSVGITVFGERTGHTVTYELTLNPSDRYAINPTTGEVLVGLGNLVPGSDTITVAGVSDGNRAEQSFVITVTAANPVEFVATAFTPLRTVEVATVATFRTAIATAQAGDDIVVTATSLNMTDTAWSAAQGGADATSGSNARYRGAISIETTAATAVNNIRVRPATTCTLTFTPPTSPQTLCAPVLSIYRADYIILGAFLVNGTNLATAVSSGFVTVIESDHCRVETLAVDGFNYTPILVQNDNHGGIFQQDCVDTHLRNVLTTRIKNNAASRHNGHGIYGYGLSGCNWEFVESHDCGSHGMYMKGNGAQVTSQGNNMRYSHVYDTGRGGISGNTQEGATRSRIYQNRVHDCNKDGVILDNSPDTNNNGYRGYWDVVNNTVDSINCITDDDGAIMAMPFVDSTLGTVVVGNIFSGTTQTGGFNLTSMGLARPAAEVDSHHNFFCNGDASIGQIHNSTNFTANTHANLTAAQSAGYEVGSLGMAGDPFTNRAGGDYTLHVTNYTAGAFVPDVLALNGGANVLPGCYIAGTEQIGRVA